MKRSKGILEQVVHGMELSAESMPRESLVELIAGRRALIEHHYGISQYSREAIHVKVRNGEIHVIGKRLALVQMTQERLIITGEIACVQMCTNRKGRED